MKRGAEGFGAHYWETLFAEPERMECVGNADRHANYLEAALKLELIPVRTVVGIGVGLAHLFSEVMRRYKPRKALALEPSPWAWSRLDIEKLKPLRSTNLRILQQDLLSWCQRETPGWERFDLGLCTSVFQYLSRVEIEHVLPVLSQRIGHLYFTVPTDQELQLQVEECGLRDEWAIPRSAEWYRECIRPHFAMVSGRILQSRVLYDYKSSPFTDLLYRI
jgi:hypothetical protein